MCVFMCMCVYYGGGSMGLSERFLLLLLQYHEILINLILLYDTGTILLAENMTVLYGCNKKSQP